MKATLDILLSKQLSAGKLFVGQKIRVKFQFSFFSLV